MVSRPTMPPLSKLLRSSYRVVATGVTLPVPGVGTGEQISALDRRIDGLDCRVDPHGMIGVRGADLKVLDLSDT